ncbi:MAG: DNA recombination protein RmuC [Bacteriovoracaceae bacterium]|jgi:DNA recombination protein RmuC|nr:DNA recombination protein RmuC [Bacteriovoracaceae bacterium]
MENFLLGFFSSSIIFLVILFLKSKKAKDIDSSLMPLKEKIDSYQNLLDEQKERFLKQEESLKAHVQSMLLSTRKVEEDTGHLLGVIKGDNKQIGDWGEVVLENTLEICGLINGKDYITQGEGMDLRDEYGALQKPDVIVLLPEEKNVIIDSKVSLKSMYQDDLRSLKLSVKNHIDDLSKKNYQQITKLNAPDFVIMFVPLESTISLLFKNFPDIFDYAYKKNIVIASPLTLMPILRTISSLWRISSQNSNANEIARQAGLLYDRFINFNNDIDRLGKNIEKLSSDFEQINSKLSIGKDNLVQRASKLKELGAKTSK